MLQLAVAGTLALSMLGAPLVSQPTTVAPPDKDVILTVQAAQGSGCPTGSYTTAISPDKTAFTVAYSKYTAQAGPGVTSTDNRRNCQLMVWVHVPSGFTYAIAAADYRGYGNLAKGATAVEQASYYFQGNPQTAYKSHSFSGPMDDNWQTRDETDAPSLSFLPCGEIRYLNINTELRVKQGTSNQVSYMTMDSVDGSLRTIYHFAWQKCPIK